MLYIVIFDHAKSISYALVKKEYKDLLIPLPKLETVVTVYKDQLLLFIFISFNKLNDHSDTVVFQKI